MLLKLYYSIVTMIKFYIPDGHLEKKTIDLFTRAGFDLKVSERGYTPKIDDDEILLKRLRPQDFPFILSLHKGDIGITGTDILTEFKLNYPDIAEHVEIILPLGFGATRLVAAISHKVLPSIKNIGDFKAYADEKKAKGENVIVATEYPAISGNYLRGKGIDNIIIRKPAGKTEAWLVPPDPEADLIIDTTETGTTLLANNCKELDTVMEAHSVLIANSMSMNDANKKRKIYEVVQLFTGALEGEGRVNVWMDVIDPVKLDGVLEALSEYVEKPTISELKDGGYDVFVVICEKHLKYMLPKLKDAGASSISVSDTRLFIE